MPVAVVAPVSFQRLLFVRLLYAAALSSLRFREPAVRVETESHSGHSPCLVMDAGKMQRGVLRHGRIFMLYTGSISQTTHATLRMRCSFYA